MNHKMLSVRFIYGSTLFCLLATVIFFYNTWIPVIKHIDDKFLNNRMENFYGILIGENWNTILSVDNGTKLFQRGDLVGHATGFRGMRIENTADGLYKAQSLGLSHFEIDLVYDGNIIYCAHEIELLTDCTFVDLVGLLKPNDLIILDIKSDLRTTVQKIRNTQNLYKHLDKMIFQLYKPNDLKTLKDILGDDQKYIFTLYRSHRSIEHICKNISGRLLEVVVHQRFVDQLNQYCSSVNLIVHPVSDCQTLDLILSKANVVSAFISGEALQCKLES